MFICIDFASIFRTHILGGLLIKAALNPNRQFRLTLWVKRVVPWVKKGRNPLWSNPFFILGLYLTMLTTLTYTTLNFFM